MTTIQKALVVEDEVALQTLYGRILETFNYDVITASDGYDAIDKLQQVSPNLILLDIRMPHCNGYEVLQFLQNYPNIENIHVVIVTATREYETYTQLLPSAEFLLKPVLPPQLADIAQNHP